MVANRNGFFYTLDRATGELLVGKPFTGTQVGARARTKDGKPIVLTTASSARRQRSDHAVRARLPRRHGLQPAVVRSGAAAVLRDGARDVRHLHADGSRSWQPGAIFMSGGMRKLPEPDYSALRAIDPKTGAIKWEHKFPTVVARRRDVHGVGPGVRRRPRRLLQRVRVAQRASAVVVSHRLADLGRGGDDLHARRPAVRADPVGQHDRGVRAAGADETRLQCAACSPSGGSWFGAAIAARAARRSLVDGQAPRTSPPLPPLPQTFFTAETADPRRPGRHGTVASVEPGVPARRRHARHRARRPAAHHPQRRARSDADRRRARGLRARCSADCSSGAASALRGEPLSSI